MTKLSPPELDITKLPDRCQALLDEMHEETGISREILLSVMLTVKAASVQDTHEVELSGGQRTSLQIYMCLSSASGSGKTSACAKCVFRSIRSRIGIEVRSAIRIHSINRELNFFYRFLTRFFAAFHYRGIFPQ